MALPATTATLVAAEAIDWVAAISSALGDASSDDIERVKKLATEEIETAADFARVIVADRCRELLRAVRSAIATGEIPAAWDRGEKLGHVITTGLAQHDPRIAFQASLRSAYAGGRHERGMRFVEEEPFFVYRTMRDSRVRSSHQVLNGVALPKSHPFWKTHYPPNGWRCRCKAYSVDQAGLDTLTDAGIVVLREVPEEALVEYKNKATGKTEKLPASVEPGWGFNPGTAAGKTHFANMLSSQLDVLRNAPVEAL